MLSGRINDFKNFSKDIEECDILLDLAVEEADPEVQEEVLQQLGTLDKRMKKLSLADNTISAPRAHARGMVV